MYTSLMTELIMCIFLSVYLVFEYQLKSWIVAMTIVPLVLVWGVKIWMYRNSKKKEEDTKEDSKLVELTVPTSKRTRDDSDNLTAQMEE